MPDPFSWDAVYGRIVSDGDLPGLDKKATIAARRIERDILASQCSIGDVFSDRAGMNRSYDLGKSTLLEAVRILEERGVARMRRGPGGGLVVTAMAEAPAVAAATEFLLRSQITPAHLHEARLVIGVAAEFVQAAGAGTSARAHFSQSFRHKLQAGNAANLLPGSNLAQGDRLRRTSPHRVIRLFSAMIDDLELRMAQGAQPIRNVSDMHRARLGPAAQSKASLAEHMRVLIEADIERRAGAGVYKLGTESDLCERFNVCRPVMRQAIRVLERHGAIESRRGRSNGIVVSKPKSTAIVERLVGYLSSWRVGGRDFEHALEILGRVLRSAVSRRASGSQRTELLTLTGRPSANLAAGTFTARMSLDWDIIDNPILSLMERTLTAHFIRLISVSKPVYAPWSEEAIRQERERLIAMAWQDVIRADQIFEDIYSRTRSGSGEAGSA
ncbi:MAG: hypothetical protein JWR77_1842 [Rhizorhabdus sp.]|nr:hypothetical protein [Rhizorhabdus sp.]